MRLDGGHPALELVNTIYGQVGGPIEADVLASPADLVTFARRIGVGGVDTPETADALEAGRALRDTLDALFRARVARTATPPGALAALEKTARTALAAACLTEQGGAITWTWAPDDAHTPVHRLAHAALELLSDETELARIHQCAGCCWLFLDHSRGAGRRWCSMADCGTEAKKRRYVQRRRDRKAEPAPESNQQPLA